MNRSQCLLVVVGALLFAGGGAGAGGDPEADRPGSSASQITDPTSPLYGCMTCYCTLIDCLGEPDKDETLKLKISGCLRFATAAEFDAWSPPVPGAKVHAITDFDSGMIVVNCDNFTSSTQASGTQWQKKSVVFEESFHYVHQLLPFKTIESYGKWVADHLMRDMPSFPPGTPYPRSNSAASAWKLYEEVQAKTSTLQWLIVLGVTSGDAWISPSWIDAVETLSINLNRYLVDLCDAMAQFESTLWPTTAKNQEAWDTMKECKKAASALLSDTFLALLVAHGGDMESEDVGVDEDD